MRKIISFILLMSMTFILCSCGGETVELLSFIGTDVDGVIDCDGKEFNFSSPGPGEWYVMPEDKSVPTLEMERKMDRYAAAAEKFNFEFVVDVLDQTNLVNLFATGDDIPEMLYVSSRYAYDIYKMGILESLEDISTIDINDSKWGAHSYIQFGSYDGKFYGFIPWNWTFVPQYCGAVIFNGDMIKEYGGIDPYEMMENGDWTWANWESELRRYAGVDSDGVQRWGALLTPRFAARAAVFSNGGSIVDRNDLGEYTYGLNSPESIEALEFLSRLTKEGLVNDNDVVKDCEMGPFTQDNLAPFYVGESWYGTSLSNLSWGADLPTNALTYYGYMPFPVGPKGDSSTDVGGYMYRNGLLCYVTSMADIEPDNIGAIIDYIFEPLDDFSAEAWKDHLDTTIFSETNHDKCLSNFVFAIENIEYDYSSQMSDSSYESIDRILEQIISGSKTAVEAVSSIKDIVMGEFD